MYEVRENGSGLKVSGLYKTRQRAQRRADRLDLIYGAVHYHVEKVEEGTPS